MHSTRAIEATIVGYKPSICIYIYITFASQHSPMVANHYYEKSLAVLIH
jgi:hypothetical protein